MRRIITIALITALLAISCRNIQAPETLPGSEDVEYASQLFDDFWRLMNRKYVFWFLDSPGSEWDSVYDEYYPLFKALDEKGTLKELSAEDSDLIKGYFYDILSPLSDGHFSMNLSLPGTAASTVMFSPGSFRHMRDIYTDEEIRASRISGTSLDMSKHEIAFETPLAIWRNLGLCASAGSSQTEASALGSAFREGMYYAASDGNVYDKGFLAGITDDDILYAGHPAFGIWNTVNDEGSIDHEKAAAVMEYYFSILAGHYSGEKRLKGIVFDLRGNSGGYNIDLQYVYGYLAGKDVTFAEYNQKSGAGRQEYSADIPYAVNSYLPYEGCPEGSVRDIPVAVLINSGSASNGEIVTLFFRQLQKEGFNARLFGTSTYGAFASLFSGVASLPTGSFSIGSIVSATLSNFAIKDASGISYEAKGVAPDEEITVTYDEFSSGNDPKLSRALEWIRGQ